MNQKIDNISTLMSSTLVSKISNLYKVIHYNKERLYVSNNCSKEKTLKNIFLPILG